MRKAKKNKIFFFGCKKSVLLRCKISFCVVLFTHMLCIQSAMAGMYIPEVDAKNALAIEAGSGRILYYKHPFDQASIASTTKIMTALVALENADVADVFEVSAEAATIGGSSMGLKKSEKLSLYALLYGLLLKSGNDAAITIAQGVGKSLDGFSVMMNQKAKGLELLDTHFVTPHGLDTPDHYSSAYDLGRLALVALHNKEFSKIVSTQEISIAGRHLRNTNPFLPFYQGVDGVKTGYTSLAGRCLVLSAKQQGLRVVVVVLNCSSSESRLASGRKILDYVFSNFKIYPMHQNGEELRKIPVHKGKQAFVQGVLKEELSLPLSQKEKDNLFFDVQLPTLVSAPIEKNAVIGEVVYRLSGEFEKKIPIFAEEAIQKKITKDYFLEIMEIWIKDFIKGLSK